ncbi:MAG: hypothetical protein WCQ50_05750 [Spirochaetota bacterium]
MEHPTDLAAYLPLSFKSEKEQEYIEFLWDAFETNYTHGKYQFAFLAYHMLPMSFVYFNIRQIKQTEQKDFAMRLIGFGKDIEKSLLEATSSFVFRTVNERSILRFPKLIGCDNGKIGTYAKLVEEREYAEAADQIREVLIHGNYLSQRNTEFCLGFDVDTLADHPGIAGMRVLHAVFVEQSKGVF